MKMQVALVTGAARRVGAEIARTLHAAGMHVVLHYHTSEVEAVTLCEALNALRPDSAKLLQGDLAMPAAGLVQLAEKAVQCWGQVDVLVNNASSFYRTAMAVVADISDAAYDRLFEVNLKAPFFLSVALAPFLRQSRGAIVNICDIHAERPMREYAVYCMTKAGLVMQTRALAKEFAPEVRVNAVSPGVAALPEGENTLAEEEKAELLARIPLGRFGRPQDIARTVLFLVRDAEYVTGQIFAVDGGRLCGL